MNSNAKVILGVIAAAAAGVAIGMLLAPEKGSDIRRNLKTSVDELGDKLNDLIAEGKNRVKSVTDELRNDVNTLKADAQTTVEHGKKIVS